MLTSNRLARTGPANPWCADHILTHARSKIISVPLCTCRQIQMQPVSEFSSEEWGTAWKCRAAHLAEKRRVVHGEQSQHLSPSDPALAPTLLMASPGMWPPIAGGRQTGERQHQRKAQSSQRLYIINISATSMYCIFTSVFIIQAHTDTQNLTIWIWEWPNSIHWKREGTVRDTNRGPSRVAVFPEAANFGTRGKGRYSTPPFQGLGASAKSLSSLFFSPWFPLCLQFLHLFTASRAKLCVPLNNTPSVTLPSSPLSVKTTQLINLLPKGSEQLPAEGNVRVDRLIRWSANTCTIHTPTSNSQNFSWGYVWHN